MRRAPARPVRACFVRTCCAVVVQEHDLRATPAQCNAKRALSSHFTLHSSHPALHTSHLHFTLHTSCHLKSCELFSPHLSSSHLIPSLLTCHLSKFFLTIHFIWALLKLSHLTEVLLNSSQLFCTSESFYCERETCCTQKPLTAESFCGQKLETQIHLHRKNLYKYLVLKSLHKALPSSTLRYKPCTKYSQYYFLLQCPHFVLQSLHKALPSITLYYKACTKHFPVLLCTTKLAQSTSMYYYFVLQSLQNARPITTLYYKVCTQYFPVYCTTKLAQSTSLHYFVLQSLHKVLPCTTLYYKACTKHFPVLLCTTKLAQSAPQYYFVLQSLHGVPSSTTLHYKRQ